jgi:hypothetical protein
LIDVHIILKGAIPKSGLMSTAVRLFHQMCWEVDKDWPWVDSYNATLPQKLKVCGKCGGRIYKNPRLAPADIKAAAKQAGVKVKIRRYEPEWRCYPTGCPAKYVYPTVEEVQALTPVVVAKAKPKGRVIELTAKGEGVGRVYVS